MAACFGGCKLQVATGILPQCRIIVARRRGGLMSCECPRWFTRFFFLWKHTLYKCISKIFHKGINATFFGGGSMIGFLGHCWGIDSVLIEASSVEISQITLEFPTVEEGALGSISGAPQPEARFGKRVGVVLEINKNMYMSTCNDTFGIQHTGRIRYNITVAQQSITIITSGWE